MWFLEWAWIISEKPVEVTHRYVPVTPVDPEPMPEQSALDKAKETFRFRQYIEQLIAWYDRYSVRRQRFLIEKKTPERIRFHNNPINVMNVMDKKYQKLFKS